MLEGGNDMRLMIFKKGSIKNVPLWFKGHCISGLYMLILATCFSPCTYGQKSEKRFVRKGNTAYENKNYNDAEILYRKAMEKHENFAVAQYNLGNSLYRQNKFEEAASAYQKAIGDGGLAKTDLAKAYHNMGNSLLQSKKIAESIEAYKQALRINPKDLETKYNLALAQKLLKNNPQQNQNNQGQNQNPNQNQNQNQNNDNQGNNNQQNKPDNQQGNNPQGSKMSKDQANQLLEAIQNDENNTLEKVKKEQAKGVRVRPDKDW